MTYNPQTGFTGIAETLMAIAASGTSESQDAGRRLRRWLRYWRLVTLVRRTLRPWYLMERARWHAQAGRRHFATRRLLRGIRHADRMQLPYESAMLRAELARLKNPGDSGRNALIDQACAICSTIGAAGLLKDTQALK